MDTETSDSAGRLEILEARPAEDAGKRPILFVHGAFAGPVTEVRLRAGYRRMQPESQRAMWDMNGQILWTRSDRPPPEGA